MQCGILQNVKNGIPNEKNGDFFCFKCYYQIVNESNNIKLKLYECQQCGKLREGNIDINDGLFYCFQCWKLFESTNHCKYIDYDEKYDAECKSNDNLDNNVLIGRDDINESNQEYWNTINRTMHEDKWHKMWEQQYVDKTNEEKTDYKNKNGKGKFMQYVEDNDLNEDAINDELSNPMTSDMDDEKVAAFRLDSISKAIDPLYSDFKENKPLKRPNRKRKHNIQKDVEYVALNNWDAFDTKLKRIHDNMRNLQTIQGNIDDLDATIYDKECYLFSQQTGWRYYELLRMEQYTMIKKGIENMISTTKISEETKNIFQKNIELIEQIDKLHRKQIYTLDEICEISRTEQMLRFENELIAIDGNDCYLNEIESEDIERKQMEESQGKESKKKNELHSKDMKCFRLQNKNKRLEIERGISKLHDIKRIHEICKFHHQFEHNLNAPIEGKQNNINDLEQLLMITKSATNILNEKRKYYAKIRNRTESLFDIQKAVKRCKMLDIFHNIHSNKFDSDINELKESGQIEIGKQNTYKYTMSEFVETEPFQRFRKTKAKIDIFGFKIYLYPNGSHKNKNDRGMVQYLVSLESIPENIESVVVYVKLYCKETNSEYMTTKTFHQNKQNNSVYIVKWHNHLSLEHCKQYNYLNFQYEIQILQINRLEKEKGNKLMTTDHAKAPQIFQSAFYFYINKRMLSAIKFSKKRNNIWYQFDLNGKDNSICYSLKSNSNQKDVYISLNVFKFPPKTLKYAVTFTLSINHKKLHIKQSENCVIDYNSTECRIKLNEKQKEMLLSSQLPQNQKLCMKLKFIINKIWIRDYPNTPYKITDDGAKNKKKYKQNTRKKAIKYNNNNKRKKKNKKFNKTKTEKNKIITDSKEDKINGIDNNKKWKIIRINPRSSGIIRVRKVNDGHICTQHEDVKEIEQQQIEQHDIDNIDDIYS